MSETKIKVTVTNGAHKRTLEFASNAWPLRVGSDPQCAIALSGPKIAAENAVIVRQGVHNYVIAQPGAPVQVRDESVPVGEAVRFDNTEILVGPFGISVDY